ncbi:unnamed protein product [Aureobasidium mustum]|uniref:Uncharacterized protein n=1 Tax=Aureobasidium mustum TaxID=2773714 RepID=A0A9N8JZQ4_9PEZI|nr:unnamed protein product [Aureobasidium mustum]
MPLVVPGMQSSGGDDKTSKWMEQLMGKKLGDSNDNMVDFGYRENLREHKKKKKGAAAKNKWDSDNEEEKKPDGDNNGDQPNDAGGSGGADGAGGEGGEGNDDDDWDDEKTDDPPPVEEAPAEEDDWGFTTASSKKKKKKGKMPTLNLHLMTPSPTTNRQSNSFSFGSNGAWGTKPAGDDGWATFGGSKKDKKKKTNAFNFGFEDADDGAMPGESAPQPAEEEPKADDNPWAAFGSEKKKNKGGAVEEPPLASPEPEPEAIAVQSPDDPADDFSWGMSAKDKKKAKKAAKAAAQAAVLAEPEPEPIVVVEESPPEPEASPAESEPAPPPQDDWFGWGTAGKKKGKKDAEEVPPEVPPPPPAAPKPASKSPEPEPVLEDPVVMVPEAIDEPKAEEDDWAGWATGKKSKKKGSKNMPVEIVEPVYDVPVQQPDPAPAEEDAWAGWSVGKKEKKKGKKIDDIPPPPLPAIEPPPVEVIEPVVEVPAPPPEVQAPVEPPADDPWASFSTRKIPPPPPEPEQLVDLQEPEIESEPIVVLESPPAEEPVKEVKKKESKSSSKDKDKEKEKEKEREKKEKEEKDRQEREAEEQRKADEEAAFAAALASEPVDLLPEPGPVVEEPISTGYWGTFLKPTAVSKTVEEPIVSKGKVDTGAKESVKDRIKRLQGENTKDQVVVVPPPSPAPEPLPEPEVVMEPEVIVVPEPPMEKEPSPPPPPPPAAIEIPPPVVEVPPSLSPIPGGFPEDDKSTKSSRPAIVDLSVPSTPAAESKSVKKERPKVVRDPTGSSHWGLWGTTPKAESKKERRPSKDTTTPAVKRSAAPGLTRSKSARKPNERDFLEKVDKTSSDDKQSRKNIKDPATPAKGMGFSIFGPTPTRSRSMRQSSSAQRPAQVRESRRSFDVSSPPGDIASKAAKLMGLGPRPSLSRSQSTREKRKSRTVPDPYAIDLDNTPDDATHSASVDRSSSHRTRRSSRSDHKHDKRDSAMMSGGLGPAVGDGADPITAPEDTPFVAPSRPMLKRSATTSARKPAGGLFSNIIDSLKSKPAEDFSRRHRSSQAYDSEDNSARHRRHRTPHSSHRDEDDDSKRHLRREHRRVRRPEDVPSTPLDEHAPTPPADNTESEDRERRRAERRAKRAALEAAEEDLRAREKASRHREREEAERDRQGLEDQQRRQRRAERHASRRSSAIDADRKPRLHRSSTAPVQSYFDARAPGRDANGRDPRSPPKDKTSSWVHSVTSSPPLPPPLQPTILDLPPTDPAVDDADIHDDESTARELRRRHRRDRESRGVETEEDRKRRKRKELRRREEELAFRDRDGETRRDRGSNKAHNSLGYDDFETQRTWDGRVVGGETRGGVKEEIARRTQGWFKKVAGL